MILQSMVKVSFLFLIATSLLLAACQAGSSQNQAAPAAPPAPANASPVITELAAAIHVQPLSVNVISCTASDAEGDNLTYKWTASGGSIDGNGATVNWTAPEKGGDFNIQVTVTDSHGNSAVRDVIINVPEKPNNPPVITSVKFTRQGRMPIVLKHSMTDDEKTKAQDLIIRVYDTAEVSVQASDPDDDRLDCTWTTSGGSIKGTGPLVKWIAPGAGGTYTITCEVTDNKGGADSLTFTVTVKCCGV